MSDSELLEDGPVQRPSVGRIVHFYDSYGSYDRREGSVIVTPKAAIVTYVHDDERLVDLDVFYPARGPCTSLVRVPYGEDENCWSWPTQV
jgi:hypothetical protein